jgi:hypothetical protein
LILLTFCITFPPYMDSLFCIVMGWTVKELGCFLPGARQFSRQHPDRLLSQSSSQSTGVPRVAILGVKWPQYETDHQVSLSVKVRNVWINTTIPNISSWISVQLCKWTTLIVIHSVYNRLLRPVFWSAVLWVQQIGTSFSGEDTVSMFSSEKRLQDREISLPWGWRKQTPPEHHTL